MLSRAMKGAVQPSAAPAVRDMEEVVAEVTQVVQVVEEVQAPVVEEKETEKGKEKQKDEVVADVNALDEVCMCLCVVEMLW